MTGFSGDKDRFVDFFLNNLFFLNLIESRELNQFIEFSKECFYDLDLDFKSWGVNFEFSEFSKDSFEVNSKLSVKFFVSYLTNTDVSTNCNSKSFFFNDFVNIL